MPRYCFEVRFRTAKPIPADRFEHEFKTETFKQPLTISRAEGMNTNENWLVFRSCGYADFREAKLSGKQLQEQLLIVSADNKVGIEFYLRLGVDGMHIFPDGILELRDPGQPTPTPLSTADLKRMMEDAVSRDVSLTPNQRVAAELLNDSFFDMPPEARFLLRVSAVEALSPQPTQTGDFRKITRGLIASIPKEATDCDRNQIEHSLNMLAARKSVRSACLSKVKQLLGKDKAKQFEDLYDKRSAFLHNGAGRGTLDAAAEKTLELGLELLLADVTRSTRLTAAQ
jgi:hypothetical protein